MTKYVRVNLKVVTSDFLTARSVSPSRTLPECQISDLLNVRFATIASRYAEPLDNFFKIFTEAQSETLTVIDTTPSMQVTQFTQQMQQLSYDGACRN